MSRSSAPRPSAPNRPPLPLPELDCADPTSLGYPPLPRPPVIDEGAEAARMSATARLLLLALIALFAVQLG